MQQGWDDSSSSCTQWLQYAWVGGCGGSRLATRHQLYTPMAQSARTALLVLLGVSEWLCETMLAGHYNDHWAHAPCLPTHTNPVPTLFTCVPSSLQHSVVGPAALPQTANFFIQYCTARAVFNNFLRLAWPHAGSMLTGLFRSLTCLCRPRSVRDATLIHMVPSGRIPSWYNGILQVGSGTDACVLADRVCLQGTVIHMVPSGRYKGILQVGPPRHMSELTKCISRAHGHSCGPQRKDSHPCTMASCR